MEQIISIIESITKESVKQEANSTPKTIHLPVTFLISVMEELHQNPSTYFDQLSCITGIDNGPQANTMEVIYHLYSIPFNQSLAIKVVLAREHAAIESISAIWKSADWLEREVYDMFGIHFNNHPDLRRILMPADWEGHPLRKDYQHQDSYRDIKVKL